jgi:hypothetical protein
VVYLVELCFWQRLLERIDGGTGGTRELAGTRFALRQTHGPLVIVDPSCAEIRLAGGAALRRKVTIGEDAVLDTRLFALYARLGRARPRRSTVICRERRLRGDDLVWVCGELRTIPAADGALGGGYREPPRSVLLRASSVWVT